MDSRTRPAQPAHPAALAVEAPAAGLPAEAPPGALARLGRILPGADALVRFAYRLAGASAVAAVLVWLALFEGALRAGGIPVALALVVAVALLLPAAAAALAGWTLADLVRIPGQLREAALAARAGTAAARTAPGSRLAGVVRTLWAARGLALTSQGAWLKAVGALRFVRLASLPFALGLLGLVALNGVVLVAGAVALLVLLV